MERDYWLLNEEDEKFEEPLDIRDSQGRRKWTKEEEEFLIKNYLNETIEYIANKLERSSGSIERKLEQLRVKGKIIYKKEEKNWSEKEIKFLFENYGKCSISEIAIKLGRSCSSVANRASRFHITKSNWTKEEEAFVVENYLRKTVKEMGKKLGRTEKAVRNHIAVLQKEGVLSKHSDWTGEEEKFLLDNFKKVGSRKISKILGRTYPSVRSKYYKLKIKGSN